MPPNGRFFAGTLTSRLFKVYLTWGWQIWHFCHTLAVVWWLREQCARVPMDAEGAAFYI